MDQAYLDEPVLNFFGQPSETEDADNIPAFDSQIVLALEKVMTCWSRMDGKHRLIARRNGNVIAASDTVDRFLARFTGIQLRKGKLHAGSRLSAAALDRALRASSTETAAEIVSCQSSQERCIIRSASFDDAMVCMSLQPVDEGDHTPALPDLSNAFGLTPSEAAVVAGICSGQTPQDIAARNNISIHTVRAHLRHCYGKLGVSCREELWHKLRPYLIR